MKNSIGFLLLITSFTLFFLKIYDLWIYICLVIIGLFISYSNFITQSGHERKKDIILKVLGIAFIVVVYWYYFNK